MKSREQRIRKIASEWLIERDEGLSPEQNDAFNAWKNEDIRHEIAVRDLEATWNRLGQLGHLIDDPTLQPNPDILSTNFRAHRRRHALLAFAISCAATIALIFAVWALRGNPIATTIDSTGPITYSTTVNDYKQIALSDGSVLEMNANTEVRVNYSDRTRQIDLLKGEAHFKVEKDPSRPFLVDVGSVSVKAVGTEFNVQFNLEEVRVLVTEGIVSVNPLHASQIDQPENESNWAVPELVAGDQATISIQGEYLIPLMSKVESEFKEEILAWKGPRLFFDSTPLEEAAKQFNKHNTVKVVIEGDEIKQLLIGGSFLLEDVEAFVRLLALDGSISVDRTHPHELVLKSAY